MQQKQLYWPQLDGLRAIAFLLVFLHHFGQPVKTLPLVGIIQTRIAQFGWLGVDFFFVLSAFLVTYLLRMEQNNRGAINIKHFYARRILRIWPLYFTVLLCAGFVWPLLCHSGPLSCFGRFIRKILLPLTLFTGNSAIVWNFDVILNFSKSAGLDLLVLTTVLCPFWSLCVEEQFYLTWGIVFHFLKNPRVLKTFFGCILLCGIGMPFYLVSKFHAQGVTPTAYYLDTRWQLEPIMFGAIVALITHEHPCIMRYFSAGRIPAIAFIASTSSFLGLLLLSPSIDSFSPFLGVTMLVSSIIFSTWLLLALSWTPLARVLSLKWFASFGKITFGMYVFHYFVIAKVKPWLAVQWHINPYDTLSWAISATVCLAATTFCAFVSWNTLEKPANNLRHKLKPGGRSIADAETKQKRELVAR
jgi:peptidoglycan/LPS O-acetylase OafA/YrhL